MYVKDIMTTNVVTISSSANVIKAGRIMKASRFRRLPVVDKGKLVGIISTDKIERRTPSKSTQGMWELAYSLGALFRTPVKQIMQKEVVTVTPDMTVEEALAKSQANRVGSLVVVKDSGEVVGIVTTNDFFLRIVNKVLGLGEPGCRIEVTEGGEGQAMEEIISTINKLDMKIVTLHIVAPPQATKKDIIIHLDCDNVSQLLTELKSKKYKVSMRKR